MHKTKCVLSAALGEKCKASNVTDAIKTQFPTLLTNLVSFMLSLTMVYRLAEMYTMCTDAGLKYMNIGISISHSSLLEY